MGLSAKLNKKAGPKGGAVKSTTDGKSTDKNATNVISGTKVSSKPLAPHAKSCAR